MKQNFWFLLLLASVLPLGCKKSNDTGVVTATSTWTFDSKTYSVTMLL